MIIGKGAIDTEVGPMEVTVNLFDMGSRLAVAVSINGVRHALTFSDELTQKIIEANKAPA